MPYEEFGPEDGVYTRIAGMDPEAEWLFGPGLQDYVRQGANALFSFTMKINDPDRIDVFNRMLFPADGRGPQFLIPDLYFYPKKDRFISVGQYFTGFTKKSFFDRLATSDDEDLSAFRDLDKEIRLGSPIAPMSLSDWEPGDPIPEVIDPVVGPPQGGWPSDTVVMGIIDDGIAFAHERFRTRDYGSRVQCFWRQDGPKRTPSTVTYGYEICKQPDVVGRPGIDVLLNQCTVAGALNEDKLYRRAELINFALTEHKSAAWRVAHGTHLLDLAAGAAMAQNVLNRPIICVQLPTAVTEDSSLRLLKQTQALHDAIAYILNRADALAGGGDPLPVVINFSYGNLAGPHDGTGPLERELENFLQAQGDRLRIVVPSGNSHLSRCHAHVRFAGVGRTASLQWRVPPDDKTPSFVQVWLPKAPALVAGTHRVKLSIVTPGGTETSPVGETHNSGVRVTNDAGEIIGEARYVFEAAPTGRGSFRITLQPTARLQPPLAPIAPAGVWTLKVHNQSLGVTDSVHAWIQSDDPPLGYPRLGRQSYFDERCYKRYDAQGREVEEDTHSQQPACDIKRAGLINALATGYQTIVASGYLRKELRFARYSAGGMRAAGIRRPDAALVSDDSKVHAGVLAAGSRSGSRVAINGTSVAAPQLARWIADNLAAGALPGRVAVCDQARLDERNLPAWKPAFKRERGGCGRMLRDSAFPRERFWDWR
jgi:hypothetical protein